MQFKDIIGQASVKKQLIHSVKEGRLSHAQLFAGPAGSGALLLALAYAQYICCEKRLDNDSCGECLSCRKYQKLVHPDLHFSYPFIAPKKENTSLDYISEWRELFGRQPYFTLEQWMQQLNAENKQPNINIAECHSIIQKLSLKPYESEFKVLIMWLPEFLREQSNALLKIIEEPSQKTLFLLVSENPDALLPTILSRMQLVKVPKLADEEIKSYVFQQLKADEQQANTITRLAAGSVAAANDLAANEHNNHEESFAKWMRMCFVGDGQKITEFVEAFSKSGRENQKNFLRYGLFIIRECLLYTAGLSDLARYRDSEGAFVGKFSDYIHENNAEEIIKELETAIYHIERNANPRILILDVSLQIAIMLKKKPLAIS